MSNEPFPFNEQKRPILNDWPIWPPRDEEAEREKRAMRLASDEDNAIEDWRYQQEQQQ